MAAEFSTETDGGDGGDAECSYIMFDPPVYKQRYNWVIRTIKQLKSKTVRASQFFKGLALCINSFEILHTNFLASYCRDGEQFYYRWLIWDVLNVV